MGSITYSNQTVSQGAAAVASNILASVWSPAMTKIKEFIASLAPRIEALTGWMRLTGVENKDWQRAIDSVQGFLQNTGATASLSTFAGNLQSLLTGASNINTAYNGKYGGGNNATSNAMNEAIYNFYVNLNSQGGGGSATALDTVALLNALYG